MQVKQEIQQEVPPSRPGLLVRLYWVILGNAILFFLLVLLFEKHPRLPSLLDTAYLVAVAALISIRYVDIRFLNGQTGEGKPATMTHWRRYALLIGPVGVGAWFLVRVLTHSLN